MKNAIVEYVAKTRKWMPEEYEIKFVRSDALEVYSVVHRDDLSGQTLGGGKSFEVHVDKASGTVVKELAYQ